MHKIKLRIDTKSLYINILNDNEKGHTCTVATPIKQGKSLNDDLKEIFKIPKQIDYIESDGLLKELTKNSKSVVKINNVFVFNKLKLNGVPFNADSSFCLFIKEEMDPNRVQFGRIKLHYPMTLKYEPLSIDNRKVINKISELINNYAAIIEGFEYDFDDDSMNFNVLIVGYQNIPYSKIFINNKGTGSKFNTAVSNNFDTYDSEIIALRKKYGCDVDTKSYIEYYNYGKEEAVEIATEYLKKEKAYNIRYISKEYPYSLFDIQYEKDGLVYYIILKYSFSNLIYFDLTSEMYRFINIFDDVSVFYIKEIFAKNEVLLINKERINELKTQFLSIRMIGE